LSDGTICILTKDKSLGFMLFVCLCTGFISVHILPLLFIIVMALCKPLKRSDICNAATSLTDFNHCYFIEKYQLFTCTDFWSLWEVLEFVIINTKSWDRFMGQRCKNKWGSFYNSLLRVVITKNANIFKSVISLVHHWFEIP
jgi:hypothetical protein